MKLSLFHCWGVTMAFLGLCRVDGFVCRSRGKSLESVWLPQLDTRFGFGRLPAAVIDNENAEAHDVSCSNMVNSQPLSQGLSLRVGNIPSLLAALYIVFACQLHSATAFTPVGRVGKPKNVDAPESAAFSWLLLC
jgi:hypothetical protein